MEPLELEYLFRNRVFRVLDEQGRAISSPKVFGTSSGMLKSRFSTCTDDNIANHKVGVNAIPSSVRKGLIADRLCWKLER